MKKPSFSAALAQDHAPAPALLEAGPAKATKLKDDRINTTLRISPEGLEALKKWPRQSAAG